MSSLAEYMKKHGACTNSTASTLYKEIAGFYHDAESFMETKRFDRFVVMTINKINDFLTALNMKSSRNGYKVDAKNDDFCKCLRSAVIEYSALKLKEINGRSEMLDMDKHGLILSTTFYEVVKSIPYKPTSPLYDLSEIIGGEIDYEALFAKTDIMFGESQITSPIIQPLLAILNDDVFPILCVSCLERACYDFIHLQALEHDLTDENWYTSVKAVTNEQLIWLMSKTFEHLLYEVETRAGCVTLYALPKNSPSVFHKLHDANEVIEDMKKQLEAKTEQTAELTNRYERELQNAKTEYRRLQDKLQQKDDNTAELAKLKRQLKMLENENQELREKTVSAEQYAEELHKALNEPESEAVPDITADLSAVTNKRIVFVRDKETENYTFLKRLAETFPNARFTNCIASDINAKATDLIVVFTAYVCHGTFWNAMNISRRKNIPAIVTNRANYDVIVADIVNKFQPKGEDV